MSAKQPIVTYEFGTLYIDGQVHKEGDTPLREITFNHLWNFILSNQAMEDTDVIMTVHTRGGRRYIRTGRYVGTIQTKDGQVIEILPKVYKASGKQEEDKDVCRRIFLNMLRYFTDAKARSFQNASLRTKKGFPILEVYISNYINAVESLVVNGLKKDYTLVSENQRFLKGKLDITQQITKNTTNKARFSIRYDKYIEDIPQNRIIVTTLRKLFEDSHSTTNKARISALLTILGDIPISNNVEMDLRFASSSNRLFSAYNLLIKWSSQFLLNKGFTTFAGSQVNQSLLFQAEKLFEDFVAYLFKKYAPTYPKPYKADSQNTRYFLVDRHNDNGVFRLRPDIVVETNESNPHYDCIIIDTKWKAIDSSRPDNNYLIDMKDMYQMYAYGQKYKLGQSKDLGVEIIPKLVLLYPYSERFTEQLPNFVYEEIKEELGLKLMVIPFNLTDKEAYEAQVHNIIRNLQIKSNTQPVYRYTYEEESSFPLIAAEDMPVYGGTRESMLVGCYKNEKHLEWIKANNLYNIRLGRRNGSLDKSGLIVSASRLLLYDLKHPQEYIIYQLDTTKQILADNGIMQAKGYPDLKPNKSYILYVMGEALEKLPVYDVLKLRERTAPKLPKNAPFFVNVVLDEE